MGFNPLLQPQAIFIWPYICVQEQFKDLKVIKIINAGRLLYILWISSSSSGIGPRF